MTEPTVSVLVQARDLLASEWTKLRSVRSTYIILICSAAFALGIGIFSAASVNTRRVDWSTYDPVAISLTGLLIAQLAFGVFGALSMTTEHATGLIRTTYAAAPRRRSVLAAKAAATGTVSLVAGEIICFGAFFAGQAVLAAKKTPEYAARAHFSVTLADPGVLRAVAGAGFYLFVVTMVGLALGTLIRHTAGAVAAVGLIFVQALIVNLVFPDPGSKAGDYVLLWAGQSISSIRAHVASYPTVAWSFAVCAGYVSALLAAAAFVVARRDV